MEEKRRGEKWYNGKQDSRPARRRTSKWAAYAHRDGSPAIMENRVRIDGTSGAKREISVLDRFRLAIGPFKEFDQTVERGRTDGQAARTGGVYSSIRVFDETFTVYGIYSRIGI